MTTKAKHDEWCRAFEKLFDGILTALDESDSKQLSVEDKKECLRVAFVNHVDGTMGYGKAKKKTPHLFGPPNPQTAFDVVGARPQDHYNPHKEVSP